MESELFGNPRSSGRRSFAPDPKPTRKVFSIPIHFVGSEPAPMLARQVSEEARAAAAVRVQKVFRGFLARKKLRLVRKVAAEAEEIGRRVAAEWKLIERDARERVRVSEMLMALLLRLDAVRGVRDYRKKVIRRVIALQEKVDSAVAAEEAPGAAEKASEPDAVVQEAPDSALTDENYLVETRSEGYEVPISTGAAEAAETLMEIVKESPNLPIVERNSTMEKEKELTTKEVEEIKEGGSVGAAESMEASMEFVKEMEEGPNSAPVEMATAAAIPELAVAVDERLDLAEKNLTEEETCSQKAGSCKEAAWEVREVMERVAAESQQLKGLMEKLCQSYTQQSQLMGGLIARVEKLEHAMQRMKKSKRRLSGAGTFSTPRKCTQKQQL